VSDAQADSELDPDLDIDEDDELDIDDELDDDDDLGDDDVGDDEGNDDLDGDEAEVDGNRIVGGLSAGVLDYLARSIVDDADAVDIEVEEGRRSVTLRLHVSQSDMGRVIGRRGRVAQAIRTVVRAAGAREGVDTSVDIVD
jgi:uncharacterized protein